MISGGGLGGCVCDVMPCVACGVRRVACGVRRAACGVRLLAREVCYVASSSAAVDGTRVGENMCMQCISSTCYEEVNTRICVRAAGETGRV
jgi:hypothetical protein